MERDEETGLNYHTARYYAVWLGRWVSCDPAGLVDGVNLYLYVLDNPVSFIDPTGKGRYLEILVEGLRVIVDWSGDGPPSPPDPDPPPRPGPSDPRPGGGPDPETPEEPQQRRSRSERRGRERTRERPRRSQVHRRTPRHMRLHPPRGRPGFIRRTGVAPALALIVFVLGLEHDQPGGRFYGVHIGPELESDNPHRRAFEGDIPREREGVQAEGEQHPRPQADSITGIEEQSEGDVVLPPSTRRNRPEVRYIEEEDIIHIEPIRIDGNLAPLGSARRNRPEVRRIEEEDIIHNEPILTEGDLVPSATSETEHPAEVTPPPRTRRNRPDVRQYMRQRMTR